MRPATCVLACLALAACSGESGPLVTETHRVAVAEARAAAVRIEMAGGRLDVTGGLDGGGALADLSFTFDDPGMRPAVEYTEADGTGAMRVHQPDVGGLLRRTRNEWTMRLGAGVPIDLWMRQGFGEQRLGFAGAAVRTIDANLSGGVLLLDLTEVTAPLTGFVDVGTGRAVVRIREDVPVRVSTQTVAGHLYEGGAEVEGDVIESAAFAAAQEGERVDLRLRVGMGDVDVERIAAPRRE